jgi:hypothetical protein
MSWLKIIGKLVLGISLLAVVIIIGPLATLWSLNTLFPTLAIPYTWQTWLASLLLLTPFSFGTVTGRFKK